MPKDSIPALVILESIKSIILYLPAIGTAAKGLFFTNSPILLSFSSKFIIPMQLFINNSSSHKHFPTLP